MHGESSFGYVFDVGLDAFYTFLADDGWAIASHIALSALMALFPFLIVITSLAGFLGSKDLADQAVSLMLETWPTQVADALSGEIHNVLTTTRGGALTIGLVLRSTSPPTAWRAFASGSTVPMTWSNRDAGTGCASESIGYTLIAAVVSLALSFLIVLGPLIIATARRYFPGEGRPPAKTFCMAALRHRHRGAGGGAVHPARLAAGRPAHAAETSCRASCSPSRPP